MQGIAPALPFLEHTHTHTDSHTGDTSTVQMVRRGSPLLPQVLLAVLLLGVRGAAGSGSAKVGDFSYNAAAPGAWAPPAPPRRETTHLDGVEGKIPPPVDEEGEQGEAESTTRRRRLLQAGGEASGLEPQKSVCVAFVFVIFSPAMSIRYVHRPPRVSPPTPLGCFTITEFRTIGSAQESMWRPITP